MDIKHVAKLANLPLDPKQEESLAKQFDQTVKFVDQLKDVNVKNIPQTSQVTGTNNVFRQDEIDSSRALTQEQALSNGRRTHNGFFVVPKIFD